MGMNQGHYFFDHNHKTTKIARHIAPPSSGKNVHVYVHIGVHVDVQVDVHVDAQVDVHVDVQVDVHVNVQVDVHVNVHVDVLIHAHADVQSCCMYIDVIHLMFYILNASITKVLKRFVGTGHILITSAIQVFRHEGNIAPPSSGKKLLPFLQVVLKQK